MLHFHNFLWIANPALNCTNRVLQKKIKKCSEWYRNRHGGILYIFLHDVENLLALKSQLVCTKKLLKNLLKSTIYSKIKITQLHISQHCCKFMNIWYHTQNHLELECIMGQLIWFCLTSRKFAWCQGSELEVMSSGLGLFGLLKLALTLELQSLFGQCLLSIAYAKVSKIIAYAIFSAPNKLT